jgi:starch phosphorylase
VCQIARSWTDGGPEACIHGVNGWAIGNGEDDRDDDRDAENIYNVLEHDVLPLWNQDGWGEMMKSSIVASAGFTGKRMIQDYLEFYDQFS